MSSKPVVLKDVAEFCGVNVTTVSRALRNDKRISQATTERVVAVANKMGYDPARFHAARQLRLSRHGQQLVNNTIAFWFVHEGFTCSNYFMNIQQGVLDAITNEMFEYYTSEPYFWVTRGEVPLAYRRGDIDGVVAVMQWNKAYLDMAINMLRDDPNFADRPIVNLVEELPGCSSVCPDNELAGYLAAAHLLAAGHTHMMWWHFLADNEYPNSVQSLRCRGMIRALCENGLDPDEAAVDAPAWYGVGDLRKRNADFIGRLRSHPEVTAIIVPNDKLAVEMHQTLTEAGFSVPEDISMVSFDDTDAVAVGGNPNILTTVRLPLTEIGQMGTNLLIKQIMGKEPKQQNIVVPVHLVERSSVAPPKRR